MGIGIVLVFWAVICGILASVGAVTLGAGTALLTRGAQPWRRKPVLAAAVLLPFLCVGWAGGLFLVQAFVNSEILHRDMGLGDTWQTPLPNGYSVLMIDDTDVGWVYNPRTQRTSGAIGEQEDAVAGVRKLQIVGPYVIGATDRQWTDDARMNSDEVNAYFLLDTSSGKRTDFSNYNDFHSAALQVGAQVKLEPIDTVYSRYRFTWFDTLIGVLFCIVPVIGLSILLFVILKLRRTRVLAPPVAGPPVVE